MANEFMQNRRQGLEEEFFARQNRELLDRLRETRSAQERMAALREASGISDEVVLERFVAMELSPETVAALTLAPLVHVAWSDANLDRQEREAILASAREGVDVAESDLAYRLLESWLDQRPDATLFETWQGYAKALMEELDEESKRRFREDLLQRVQHVAEASGGTLGIKRVSGAERDAMAEVERALT